MKLEQKWHNPAARANKKGNSSSQFCHKRNRLDRNCGANVRFKGGSFYQLKNGCNWYDLPRDLPPYATVFWYYKQWRETRVLKEMMDKLHGKVREQEGKQRRGQP